MSFRGFLLSSTVLSVAGCFASVPFVPAAAQSAPPKLDPSGATAPAVDGFNGKVEALGGGYAKNGLYGVGGSLAVPLQGQFGAQIDAAGGQYGDHAIGVVGGHLFWRDPRQGLAGLYLDQTMWDRYGGVHVTRLGAEGEYYWGRLTLSGIAGVETGNDATHITTSSSTTASGGGTATITSQTPGLENVARFFDHANLAYYPLDDWKASIGHVYAGGKNALALGTEYGMPVGPGIMASFFVEGRVGEGSHNYGAWAGVRFYFGQTDKSLMGRQREDDPALDWTPDSLLGIAQSLGTTTSATTQSCPPGEVFVNGTCHFLVSDIRLKRDIQLLARLQNGIGLYRYRYRWSDVVYVGVMAQEVETITPEAVMRAADGYLRVNYGRLGLNLLTLEEWRGEDIATAA
ncbi:MAG TPA: tail fiber domain-containing protein [Stellaceae bacterium]|nr:tail fiber domain-containing protein [Stellaceae bacterium]